MTEDEKQTMTRFVSRLFVLISCLVLNGIAFGQALHRVNTTDDIDNGGCNAAHCSLREALNDSNTNMGPDSIIFDIPGPGPHVISVTAPLPAIRDSYLVIDGCSQPGNLPMAGLVVLDGSALSGPADHGLVIYTRHTKIYGLQIQNFPGDGIQIFGGFLDDPFISNLTFGGVDKGNVIISNGTYGIEGPIDRNVIIEGNYIGTNLAFQPGRGNSWDGLFLSVLSGANCNIGGTAPGQTNYLCSNQYSGLKIDLTNAAQLSPSLVIQGNHIGTGPNQTEMLGNVGNTFGGPRNGGGINIIGDGDLTIGGMGAEGNIIAFNYDGIYHEDFDGKTFNFNKWICNTNGGVRLANGANNNITTPYSICFSSGTVNGFADPNVRIDLYEVDTTLCAPGTPCQGTDWLATTTTDATGFWSFAITLPGGTLVSAMATDPIGNSSEFSTCSDYVNVTAVNDGPKCEDEQIWVEAIVDGNASNATFYWYGPLGFEGFEQRVRAPSPGEYCVVVDFGNCVHDTVCTVVTYNPITSATITDFCLGDSWTINGNTYDENNPVGTEVIAGGNQFGCDSIVNFSLELNETIEGQIFADPFACRGDTVYPSVEILNSFGPYQVIYTDGVNPPDTLNDVFNGHTWPVVATENLYFEVIDINNSLTICDPLIGTSDSVVVSNLMVQGFTSDYNGYGVSCPGAEDGEIVLDVTGAVGMVEYEWNNISYEGDVLMDLPNGYYSVTVTDETGCSQTWETILTEPEGPEPQFEVIEPSCLGASDGVIIIDTVFNVMGDLFISNDSINYFPVTEYPYIIDTLSSGLQKLFFQDDGDCITRLRYIVTRGDENYVDAGGNLSITTGDSIQLGFETDIVDPAILWTPGEFLSCDNCPEPWASPPTTQYFTVSLLNEQGCAATDSVLIQVFIPKRVFIPNVFSPNNDGANDRFVITPNEFGTNIAEMIVVNRGGVTVFGGTDLSFDPSDAWDGSFQGELLNPGVFTYLIKVRFNDGQIVPFSGTVTLVR